MFRNLIVCLCASLFIGTQTAHAQRVGNRAVVLKVNFADATYWLENLDGTALTDAGRQQAGTLVPNNDIFLAKNNIVKLYIVKPNPLVYAYKSAKGSLVETADYQAVSGFAKVIDTLVQGLGTAAAAKAPGAGVTPSGLPGPDQVSADPTVVAIFAKYEIDSLAKENQFFTELRQSINDLGEKTAQMQVLFGQAKSTQTQVRRLVCNMDDACTWGLGPIRTVITSHFAKLASIRNDMIAQFSLPGVRNDPINGALSQIISQESEVNTALKAATAFASAVSQIDVDSALSDLATYDPSHDLPIDVTRVELTLAGKETTLSTKYTFTFRPDSPVTYGFGGMLAYSFVRTHNFQPTKKGDQLVITDMSTDSDYVAQQIGAVLTISPTRWVDTPFTPYAEIGVAANKGGNGLFLGIGLSPYSLFQFGAGFTLQQVSQLSAGQTVGQIISSPDDIKTVTRFRPGGYLHISLVKKL